MKQTVKQTVLTRVEKHAVQVYNEGLINSDMMTGMKGSKDMMTSMKGTKDMMTGTKGTKDTAYTMKG